MGGEGFGPAASTGRGADAGVLEIADIHVVSKADKPDAPQTVANLRAMLRLGAIGTTKSVWRTPVIATSAQARRGIDDLVLSIDAHFAHLHDEGEIAERRRKIFSMRILKASEDIIRERLLKQNRKALEALIDRTIAREIDPNSAAEQLLGAGAPSGAGHAAFSTRPTEV